MTFIHPTAVVALGAVLGDDCTIGPFCVVEDGATLGAHCRLHSHDIVHAGVTLGEGARLEPFVALGGNPQDIGFDRAKKTGVVIGARFTAHEGVTVHRATTEAAPTRIGDDCLMMANSHAAHDCTLGNHVIMANGSLLGGHVSVEDFAFISGNSIVHQGCRIGESAMLSGGSSISSDLPPFCNAARRNTLHGLNLIGMRRRKFDTETIRQIKRAYFRLYGNLGNVRKRAQEIIDAEPDLDARTLHFLRFFTQESRGFLYPLIAEDAREHVAAISARG